MTSQREDFAELLHQEMAINPKLRLLTADLGYGILDKVRRDYPHRCIDFGAAEQLMIGAAVGMAIEKLPPICYSITPFVLYRPFEWLRNFMHHDQIPVKLVGAGRDRDYGHLGFTHWAEEDEAVLRSLPNITVFKPQTDVRADFMQWLYNAKPAYLNLRK